MVCCIYCCLTGPISLCLDSFLYHIVYYCVLYAVLWIGFCLTGPTSLCLDSFLYCVLLCVVCMLSLVTR